MVGRAGAGVHVVLKAPSITINGTINTSGTDGGNGGNGGRSRELSGWMDSWGLPGGGGGGGNSGFKVSITIRTSNSSTIVQTGGSWWGSGGLVALNGQGTGSGGKVMV